VFISVRNWRRFQHYDPSERTPIWVKNYTHLLSEDAYLTLTANRRALLHGLWLVYGLACTCPKDRDDLTCTCLRLDVHLLNRRLGLHAKMSDYEALNHAGFILLLASTPLAPRYQPASPEEEKEEEKEQVPLEASYPENGHADEDIDWTPLSVSEVIEHARQAAERKGT
jgi:hypothetical protein